MWRQLLLKYLSEIYKTKIIINFYNSYLKVKYCLKLIICRYNLNKISLNYYNAVILQKNNEGSDIKFIYKEWLIILLELIKI